MSNVLKNLKTYLDNKENKNQEEENLLKQINIELSYVPIATISLNDIENAGYNVSNATQEDLELIANKMADFYDGLFQCDLDTAIEILKLPNIKKMS